MIQLTWRAMIAALTCAGAAAVLAPGHADAQNPRTLDIGGPPGDSTVHRCYTDSNLTAALLAFNGHAAVHVFGGTSVIPLADTIDGSYGVFGGSLRVDGTVRGSLIVFDGDVRVTATGVVAGDITVFGGQVTADPSARIGGQTFACADPVSLERQTDGTLVLRPATRPVTQLASSLAVDIGGVQLTPYLGVGQYNRVEALPVQVGGNARWSPGTTDTIRAQGYAVIRSARDPSASRPTVGWHAQSSWSGALPTPVSLGIEGGQTVASTADQPASPLESGLSALLLRRDYSDWYVRRGGSVFATIRPASEVTIGARYEISRQTTALAVNALSILRGDETWRPNPLIDDGKYHIASINLDWNAQNEARHPVFTWQANVVMRRVTSNELTPVSLPTTIRDAMPTSGYGETDGDFDLRGSLRLAPDQRIALRLLGGGHLGGDPLTIQDRRALGGVDPLPGYDFRAINCDRRRKPDPATPALCDRDMAMQVEYRRTLPIDLSTRVGGYQIGIRRPELVLFADAGSAWLAGDSTGRVPSNRIEALREWKSDAGIGVSTKWASLYVARSLVDEQPVRLVLLFSSHR
ncbi:MAG TPA: polymer-forming cytoskeletal protein [Gemmatimonadales bacterium]|jgi:hypothetical protein